MAQAYRRVEGIEEAPLSGELMLFQPESGRFFVLNQTMAFIWGRCHDECTFDDLMEGLTESFAAVESARARGDLQKALTALGELGLVEDAKSELAAADGREPGG